MWEASVEAVLNPQPAADLIDAESDEPDRVIGRWVVHWTPTIWEDVTIGTVDGAPVLTSEYSDGSSGEVRLVEVRAQAGELRSFRGAEDSKWDQNERVAVLNNRKLAYYDELGHIKTVEPRRTAGTRENGVGR